MVANSKINIRFTGGEEYVVNSSLTKAAAQTLFEDAMTQNTVTGRIINLTEDSTGDVYTIYAYNIGAVLYQDPT